MSPKRHEVIGIKQVTRREWYDFALDHLINGDSVDAIHAGLDQFISERRQSGGYGERGEQTYTKAVTQIMKCWVSPEKDLRPFRDAALAYVRTADRSDRVVLHWAVTIAVYPFWHRVAAVVGRLLNLQEAVSQSQIRQRCYEAFGERTTIERSARRVMRSFVDWGVLEDSDTKGMYRRPPSVVVTSHELATLLIEAVLLAIPEGRAPQSQILSHPGLFPFKLPMMSASLIVSHSERIDVGRYGLDDELLRLR
jgi:hypothetical protein